MTDQKVKIWQRGQKWRVYVRRIFGTISKTVG